MKQKGFTLIELLVVIAITGVIVLVVGSAIAQIIRGGPQITEESSAMADVDNAAHWLTRDLILAQTTSLIEGVPPTSAMTMNWSDLTAWAGDEGSVEHSAIYSLSGTQLLRNYDGEETIVGRHIINVGFSIDGKMFNVTLTSCSGWTGSTVTRNFLFQMRSDLGL